MAKKELNIEEILTEMKSPLSENLESVMNRDGLEYAWATLQDRALIDATGLKPVHLRTLYGMYKMGSRPGGKPIKVARISGEIIGKYHPHAPASVDSAIAVMAQAFNTRVPLIDYQGSVGAVTGDVAASSRYWEAALNKASWDLVKDIQENACQWTYSEIGEEIIPIALPVGWPVGIINGTQGIATGFASNIPPHNPDEIIRACIANLQGKFIKNNQVLNYIKGPDFPTGAEILDDGGIQSYLESGEGKFIVRGKYSVKELSRKKYEIIFTELPYQTSVEQVISSIKKQQEKKRLLDISEMKDLTDTDYQTDKSEVRLTIYTKSGADIDQLIEDLYKYTPCQSSFSVNATILLNNLPHPSTTMLEMIEAFNNNKIKSYKLKKNYRLKVIKSDAHVLNGLLKVLVDIDKAISIIRESESVEDANLALQKEFKVDDIQANKILSMQLRKLTKTDKLDVETKYKSLIEEEKQIEKILASEDLIKGEIVKELEDTLKIISSNRRTAICKIEKDQEEKLS